MSQEGTKSFVIGLTDFRGRKVSPSEIPIDLFDTYFTDLKRFVVGDSKDKNISVKLEDGSIKMVFIGSISFISALEADVAMIRDGTAPVSNTRAKVALRLQAYAKNNAASIYFAEDTNMKLLEITPESEILKPKGIWTDFEDYVFGKIRAVGGASPNIHVVDENGNETKISSTEEKLRGYKENMLYSSKLVHFSAQRNLTTNEVRNRFLISIEDLPAYDADDAQKRIKAATKEWEGVSTDEFMEQMRG